MDFMNSLRRPLERAVYEETLDQNRIQGRESSAGIEGRPERLGRWEGAFGKDCGEVSGFEFLGRFAVGGVEETVGLPESSSDLLGGSMTERSRGFLETLGSVKLSLPQDTPYS